MISEFLAAITRKNGPLSSPTWTAFRRMFLLSVRRSELTMAWLSGIDLETGSLVIPSQRMEQGTLLVNPGIPDHQVFLSCQVLNLLRGLHTIKSGAMLIGNIPLLRSFG